MSSPFSPDPAPGLSRRRWWLQAAVALALLAAQGTAQAQPAAQLYLLNCWGCHRAQGEGIPGTAPPLLAIGDYLRVPGGRAYLVRVPNVSQSALSDAQVALTLNWILQGFSRDHLPADFKPYTADEVASLRGQRLTDLSGTRNHLLQELRALGLTSAPH